MVFDGRGFAAKIEERLKEKIAILPRKLKLAAIVDPSNQAGVKYCQLKAKMAERLGVEFTIYNFQFTNNFQVSNLKFKIEDLNRDPRVDGIMIQLPFPNSKFLIELIDPRKDVDGLTCLPAGRGRNPFKPAVVRAVLEILKYSYTFPSAPPPNLGGGKGMVCIVGAEGFVGSRLMKELPGAVGLDKGDFPTWLEKLRRASVVISCTGQAGLIDGSMVKKGFVAIDVGYPRPEFAPSALAKASFYTPVPGGVGPVTVACLFANLVDGVKM